MCTGRTHTHTHTLFLECHQLLLVHNTIKIRFDQMINFYQIFDVVDDDDHYHLKNTQFK